jgi:hypothetical protein
MNVKRKPRVSLKPEHASVIRQVLAENPGLALRKLAPLVAERLGLPHTSDHALHNFLTLHGIPRQVPQHVVDRSERLRAKGPLFAAPLVAMPGAAPEREPGHA